MVLDRRDTIECSYETFPDTDDTCESLSSGWGLTVGQFESLNPGVQCPYLDDSELYCVLGTVASSVSQTPTLATSITTTRSSLPLTSLDDTTTSATVTAPPTTTVFTSSAPYHPQQSGLAGHCEKYHLVTAGNSCEVIETKFGIDPAQFGDWNPSINSGCTNLWTGYYVCVGVVGSTISATTPPPTTMPISGNGVATPTPIQTGIANNCDNFHLVQSGDTCAPIAAANDISLSGFYAWNPAVGASCAHLLVGYYVCIDIIGYQPPSTTTSSSGNGIATPTPYEIGMVNYCDRFYLVKSGDTCDSIASGQGITVMQTQQWNWNVGSGCTHLWQGDYICVGVL